MARVLIVFPVGDYDRADTCKWILYQWALTYLKGQDGISGKIVGPRYKGQKVNIESASPGFLKAVGWSSQIEIFFKDHEVFDYLRDCDLPEGAELRIG